LEQLARDGEDLRFQFQAKAAHVYTVEYSEAGLSAQWLSLTNFSNEAFGHGGHRRQNIRPRPSLLSRAWRADSVALSYAVPVGAFSLADSERLAD
jgi:hypothetical protein